MVNDFDVAVHIRDHIIHQVASQPGAIAGSIRSELIEVYDSQEAKQSMKIQQNTGTKKQRVYYSRYTCGSRKYSGKN